MTIGEHNCIATAVGPRPHIHAFAKHLKIKAKKEPNNVLALELDENVRLESYVIVIINKRFYT